MELEEDLEDSGLTTTEPPDLNFTDVFTTESTDEEINSFYFYATEQLAVLIVLFLLIVLGNSAVLLALALSKNRKSRMNYFIMQLAIADLLVGLINVLTDIIWRLTIEWHAGNLACKVIRYLQAVVTYSSTYVLVALSIDRYDAIRHPMKFSGSWRRAKLLVALAWILSALFSLPSLVFYEEKPVEGQLQCWIELGSPLEWQVYMSLVSVALFALPALTISACYALIVATIWRKGSTVIVVSSRATRASMKQGKGLMQDKMCLDHDHESRRASSRGLIPRAKVKTVKMTFVIVFVFILCWSPYIVFDLLQVYGYVPKTQTNLAIATFIQSLAPLNSAANPLIYCLFSTRICRTLRKLPPCSWLATVGSFCCPGLAKSGSCLRYTGTDFSSTLTSSVTNQSGRRSLTPSQSGRRSILTSSLASHSGSTRPRPPNRAVTIV